MSMARALEARAPAPTAAPNSGLRNSSPTSTPQKLPLTAPAAAMLMACEGAHDRLRHGPAPRHLQGKSDALLDADQLQTYLLCLLDLGEADDDQITHQEGNNTFLNLCTQPSDVSSAAF